MADKLTPPPDVGSDRFADWLFKFWTKVNDLKPVTTTESFISQAKAVDLTDGGDTSLHYHSADRARANHTGTQTVSTISDFNTAVQALTSGSTSTTDPLAAQVFVRAIQSPRLPDAGDVIFQQVFGA